MEAKIRDHHDEKGFPQLADFHTTQDDVDGYLFDYQAALDSEGTEKGRYTVAGILLILPILVLSAFPDESLPFEGITNVLCALLIGLVLFGIYRVLMKLLVRHRIGRAKQDYPEASRYIEEVGKY